MLVATGNIWAAAFSPPRLQAKSKHCITSMAWASVSVTVLLIRRLFLRGQISLCRGNRGEHGLKRGGKFGDRCHDFGIERGRHLLDEATAGKFAVSRSGQKLNGD